MELIQTKNIYCPYCGEQFEVILDCSMPQQNYIEDCEVCCQPIEFNLSINEEGKPELSVFHQDE